ncbi:MAG: hypothetical protein ABW061_13170, partial [Polyangiaceae bacterium]
NSRSNPGPISSPSATNAVAASLPPQPESLLPQVSLLPPVASLATEAQAEPPPERQPAESSGVHRKAVLPVEAPVNREALLSRLRARRVS